MEEQNQIMEPINGNPNFSFCRENVLGGGRDSNVFSGRFNGKDVAVKRIVLDLLNINRELVSREVTNLLELQQHEHIVKLLHDEDNKDFRFIAFELCYSNLRKYVSPEYKGLVLTDESAQLKIVLQLTDALKYIHSKNIIHRDIKPENVLVLDRNSVNLKWADFGHSKVTNDRGSASISGYRGTKDWLAPEIISYYNEPELEWRCSKTSDIFSAGCVFFFFLTNGVHPFGEEGSRTLELNIRERNMINKDELNDSHPAKSTVIKMMENRLRLDRVIKELNNPGCPLSKFCEI